ncbi:MAG: RNA repair transcriptional activator RtcR [Verrucomicrobiales bacterium]
MKKVVLSFLGTQLDRRKFPDRWQRWRPNVALCQHEDLLIDRFFLLYDNHNRKLAEIVRADIGQISPETEVVLSPCNLRDPWDFEEVFSALLALSRDLEIDAEREEWLLHMTTGTHVAQICLFLLAESRHFPGKLIQTSPPKRVRGSETVGTYQVIDLDLSKYDKLASRFAEEAREAHDVLKAGIETRNEAFNALISKIETVTLRSEAPILLTGPTGAGKSQLASKIYQLRRERGGVQGEFVEVNCATLRGDTAMSALFGHEKGAFTGAASARAGLLREAHGGILFLDEIGELGADEQAILLRAIEEGKWLPVGADRPVRARFQLIAGTNRDLREAVARGEFREDLLARINLWTFALPGLRERREDIAPNLHYELKRWQESGGGKVRFEKAAERLFLSFAESPEALWRGNFRDLNAAVTRMATLAPRGRITEAEVREEMACLEEGWRREEAGGEEALLREVLGRERLAQVDLFDRAQLAAVLRVCRESRSLSEAGQRLFAYSRTQKKTVNDSDRLRKYLAKFGLEFGELG